MDSPTKRPIPSEQLPASIPSSAGSEVRWGALQVSRELWRARWLALIWFTIALIPGIVSWRWVAEIVEGHTGGWAWLPSLVLVIVMTVALDRSLAHALDSRQWAHRLAFLTGSALAVTRWLTLAGPGELGSHPVIALYLLGAIYLGSLITTTLQEGFCENNQPPSRRIQAEVHELHQELIGIPAGSNPAKRLFDLLLAGVGLVLAAPVWALITFLVWFENPGPILFIKNSVGLGGQNFHQYKFRTMVSDAENHTGPIMAKDGDDRVLRVGRFLRKTALDELPQLVNILKGEMCFVGPRPQRTVLVHGYLRSVPGYAERHRVLPGLAGLAQVAGGYYLSPHQKLRYDRLYVRHASLGFDLKLLFLAFALVFWLRWRPGWDGRLPRRWMRFGARLPTDEPL